MVFSRKISGCPSDIKRELQQMKSQMLLPTSPRTARAERSLVISALLGCNWSQIIYDFTIFRIIMVGLKQYDTKDIGVVAIKIIVH